MKKTDKKGRRKYDKIESIHITDEMLLDREMDEFLRQSIIEEADELEEELNSDPELVGIGASDDLFLKIKAQLQAMGAWEEDEEEAKAGISGGEEDGKKETEVSDGEKAEDGGETTGVSGREEDGKEGIRMKKTRVSDGEEYRKEKACLKKAGIFDREKENKDQESGRNEQTAEKGEAESIERAAGESADEQTKENAAKKADVENKKITEIKSDNKNNNSEETKKSTENNKSTEIKRDFKNKKITKTKEDVRKLPEESLEKGLTGKGDDEENRRSREEQEAVYTLLSEEDREALEIGRKVRTQRKKKRRQWRQATVAAAAAVIILMLGMQGDASRNWILETLGRIMNMAGNQLRIDYQNEQENVRLNEKKEKEAWEEIKEELNISAIGFLYKPTGMVFDRANISKKANEVFLYYWYKETIMYVYIKYGKKNSSTSFVSEEDVALQDVVTNNQEVKIKIWNTTKDSVESYIASFEYQDVQYFVSGRLPFEEIEQMMGLMYLY